MANVIDIEGIGETYGAKLVAAGVKTTTQLLRAAGTKQGRSALADRSGIAESKILEWVNRADLMRIEGVSTQYSDLLEKAGVDTVAELGRRDVANLHAKLAETNAETNVVRRIPAESEVARWVAQAKELPRAVEY